MMRAFLFLSFLPMLSLLSEVVASSSANDIGSCRAVYDHNGVPFCVLPPDEQPACGLWMAPSTLGEGANLGMYAGVDIDKGHVIQKEIAIPIAFRDWTGPDYFWQLPEVDKSGEKDDGALWYRYIWSGWVADLETYQETNLQANKVVFVPGIGCTINSILEMRNVQSTHGSTYDTAGLTRGDPSAGAFSPYYDSQTKSVRFIPAGSEIFADYGDEWIPDIPGAQITFNLVMDRAEDFLRDEYFPFVQKHNLPPNVLEGLWNFTRDFPHSQPETFTVLPPSKFHWNDIQQAYHDLSLPAQQQNNDNDNHQDYYKEPSSLIRHFIRQNGKRNMDWLVQEGRCCDYMRTGVSNIPHAGRGAFATRDLPKGTIVGYSPLVHAGTFGLDLYNVPYTMGKNSTNNSYNKSDLVLNYAFGHSASTVLLNPYGSMVNYINHSPQPNVRVVWPDRELIAHKPEWVTTKDIPFLTHTFEKIGLSFDYIALRDIAEDEEIVMDYGREWEQAWEAHVQNWKPPKDADTYVHSSQWKNETMLRTVEELKENPYPPNLHTMCIPAYIWNATKKAYLYLPLERDYVDRVRCRILERRQHVTDPDNHPEVYTVELLFKKNRHVRTLNFPRSAIFLTDRVMSQDWHLPNTFRHPIGIPDDIFPPQWKNKLVKLEDVDEKNEEES
ncbi:Guanylate cyclase [Seminavis robusta]|uniref:Guanylate cyclase n=1 Tax=Seminavis robusta TaxID=568900 RepID=A0A9N8DNT6_9STRA|nr:Guanylate cyclase [Seminavis robusta]|eukprot:Sro242_g096590.1 Guanylate cyclase (667) ;mRNA; r:28602-30707